MTNCKEYILDNLMAIIAIPVSDVSASDTESPVNRLTPTISNDDFSLPLDNAVVIGLQAAVDDGALIPIRRGTGKVKDDESDSVAGRLHTVAVTCEVDDRETDTWTYLQAIERTASHLLLTFHDGNRAFVSADADTYLCTTERDGSKTTVAFRIQNLMGLQLLV